MSADYETYKDLDTCSMGDDCYMFWNEKVWQDSSIEYTDGSFKPAWAFLLEIKERINNRGLESDKENIRILMSNYVADAFVRNFKKNMDFTSVSGIITIPYPEYFEALDRAGIEAKDPDMEFYEESGQKRAKMKFAPAYPSAKENSAWLAAADFVVNSMLKPYKDAGLDSTEYENAIRAAIKTYTFSASKEDSKDALSFRYPPRILLSATTDRNFEYNIDDAKFTIPEAGYKTKIYIKPTSKKDAATHIVFGPFGESSYSFSWSEAISSGYVDGEGSKAAVSGADYDLNFPQQYFIRVVTYDGDKEKANVIATLETHTEETAGAAKEVTDGNSFLKISAKPSAVKQGESVTATVEAINSNDPNNQIDKVVIYACTGSAAEVGGNNSATCTYKNAEGQTEDAVKASFTGGNLNFEGNKATLSATWNTSSSAIGNHALMAKAFRKDPANAYIENSKTAVTIQVTNSEVAITDGGGASGDFTNLLAGHFSNKASDSATGSKLRTFEDLANRIVAILAYLIGAFSVIGILVGGIFYITAGGDQQKAEKGKKAVLYAVIGIAIAVLTFVIEDALISIINNIIS